MKKATLPVCAAILTASVVWVGVIHFPAEATELDVDAELLAMEISGELLPPVDLYERIHGDLEAIRAAYPAVAFVRHWWLWAPGELIVGMEIGRYADLDELNEEFGPVEVYLSNIGRRLVLTLIFEKRYNPECLAPLYAAVDGVEWAEPNCCGVTASYPGPDDISVDLPRYTFTWYTFTWSSSGGKPYPPVYHKWVFEVMDGVPTLIEEAGPPVACSCPYIIGLRTEGDGSVILEWDGPRCDYAFEYTDSLEELQWRQIERDERTWGWKLGNTADVGKRFYRLVATRSPDSLQGLWRA